MDSPVQTYLRNKVQGVRPAFRRVWVARRTLILFNGIAALLTVLLVLFFATPYYESTVTILPDYGTKSTPSAMSALASLTGVSEGTPTEIYQNLIRSEQVLRPVIYAEYTTEKYDRSVNLLDYFELEYNDGLPESLRERARFLNLYSNIMEVTIRAELDKATKILNIRVRMPESKLASEVANAVANSLDEYVRTKRKSYASNQRQYLEIRQREVLDSLSMSEEALKDFRTKNRVVAQSPELMLEYERLSRTVAMLQTVYVELSKQLELAKIEEIRDTPVLNIKELAGDPIVKTGPSRMVIVAVAVYLLFMLSLVWVIAGPTLRTYWEIVKQGLSE